MSARDHVEELFQIIRPGRGPYLVRKGRAGLDALLLKMTGLASLKRLYGQIQSAEKKERFTDQILGGLGVRLHVAEGGLGRIPKRGPLVVVANHPYGGLESAAMVSLLLSARSDVKVLANHLLARVPELESLILAVDPFHTRNSARANLAPIKRAIQWVRSGGALAVFPAGEVAHYRFSQGRVTDPVWQASIGQLIRTLKAPVLPVFFPGRNSLFFQCAGLLHPLVRTALLLRECLNKKGQAISARVGRPIPFDRLNGMASGAELIKYLRQRTYLLAAREEKPAAVRSEKLFPPVILPSHLKAQQLEVDALPPEQKLAQSGPMQVMYAGCDQIPCLLQEIGRQREVAFRAVGEGSGRPSDLDSFDQSYLHLFIWNRQKEELVGAYRMGLSDRLLPGRGKEGFYTNRLFEYPESLLQTITPGIEMGRSFVGLDYQRSYLPLLLLWRGIGKFLAQKPWYRYLFGAVSMSANYHSVSRQLLVSHLSRHYGCNDLARMVRPRNPVAKGGAPEDWLSRFSLKISGLHELSEIISDLEPDEKGVPVLIQKYLELGGKMLAFNVDAQFNNALDGLVLVDLPQANRRLLEFYMGRAEAARYLAYQAEAARTRRAAPDMDDRATWQGRPQKGPAEWQPAMPLSPAA